ncbi:ATP-binding protein [Actinoplanes solisilvae]|uniref:ATP-binding protein n=1 Tax=Actinoplanes solisilvae TaxID=2486853 RepID=UPI00196B48A5|nr:LuxR family transcriptional regulator [Actinoplanes solisilvae]
MADFVIGRDDEFAQLQTLIDRAAAGEGGALLLHGQPGIGKSALLGHAAERASAAGFRVLTGSGTPGESAFGFALLDQLLRPHPLPRTENPGVYAVAQATLELVTSLADSQPVALVVDDLHWADPASAVVLSFVGRRVGADAVLLLGARRDDLPDSSGLPARTVTPLGPSESERVVRAYAPGLSAAVRGRILRDAAGNPLALTELAQGAHGPEILTGELPLTERLEQTFAARLATLPEPARIALLAAAVGEGDVDEVLAAATEVTGQPVEAPALAPAVMARVIEPLGSGRAVRFRHPLVRAVVRRSAAGSDLRACHRALAALTADRPDRHVWHRAAAADRPDESIAAALESSAREVRERGGGVGAHGMFLRAAELSTGPRPRARRLMAALIAVSDVGDAAEAARLVRLVEPEHLDPASRLLLSLLRESYVELGLGTAGRHEPVTEVAAALPSGADVDQLLVSVGEIATRFYWSGDFESPVRRALAELLDRLDLSPYDPRRMHAEVMLRPVERAASVRERLRGLDTTGLGPIGLYQVGLAAQVCGDLVLSHRLQTSAIAALRGSSQLTLLVNALSSQAVAALLLGDPRLAATCAEEFARLATDIGQPLSRPVGQIYLAAAAGLRGDEAGSRDPLAEAEKVLLPLGATELLILVRLARGLIALGAHRPDEAYEELSAITHPSFSLFLVQPLAEAAIGAGRHDELAARVAELRPSLERTGSPALAIGLAYATAVLTDEFDFSDGLPPVAEAHLRMAYGQSLRRRRRAVESRSHLRAALRTYEAFGLGPWAARAREQLRAAGERVETPRSDLIDRLTPQELQIATLAAQGLTNRDIARRLYVSHRTIGSHLYHIYPKLGVTSRAELTAVLGPTS